MWICINRIFPDLE
ncbi:MAG: hypothetical protein HQ510_00345 [Candidatus Marinimicrobia bacterium]|nr:hypothetical protein [Candidatus Neomarinimicrobiota bacterium]